MNKGIRMIRKYFTPAETRNLITAIFYSKLYYGAEVWHFKGLSRTLHKKLKYASANALKRQISRRGKGVWPKRYHSW